MQLFGELVGQFRGPIIVVGGGPSAPLALEALRDTYGVEPVAVLSANEHGHRQDVYPITHSVCCDATHGETRQSMETLLRSFGAPIIAPHHFADIRLAEWKLAANTGLTALAVAVYMGGNPVIVTGVDCYRVADPRAATYFHATNAKSNSVTKHESNFRRQFEAVLTYTGLEPPVRFAGGNSLEFFKPFDPDELYVPFDLPPKAAYYRAQPKIVLQCRPRGRVAFRMAMVEPGRLFVATPHEARGLVSAHEAKVIETHRAPDGSMPALPIELTRAPVGYRPSAAHKPASISKR